MKYLILPIYLVLIILPFKVQSECAPSSPELYVSHYEFDNQTIDLITDLTFTNNGYSAIFSGGYINNPLSETRTTISSTTEQLTTTYSGYRTWNILQNGTSAFGNSSGIATITMNPPAEDAGIGIKAGADVQARLQFLDEMGATIYEYTFQNSEYVDASLSTFEGINPISSIRIIIDSGNEATEVSYFFQTDYSLTTPCNDSFGFGFLNPISILVLLFGFLVRKKFVIKNQSKHT